MLTNKIQKYIIKDILKNLIIILFTFTSIAWAVRAVNFLDLIIEDGFSSIIYFKYSMLHLTGILTKFTPLSFLLALFLTVIKLEKHQEFQILWISGQSKIKVVNILILTSIIVTIFQIFITFYINPSLLYKSRQLLKTTEVNEIKSLLNSNNFNDSFKGVTFFIEKKTQNDEFINIFIQDNNKSLNLNFNDLGSVDATVVTASKGVVQNDKFILYDGSIQTKNSQNKVRNIFFEKTELNIKNFEKRTITQTKIQETSSIDLINCLILKENIEINNICKNDKKETTEHILRRIIKPFYLILTSLLVSFLLFHNKQGKHTYLKKYIIFLNSFLILVFSEVILRYSGISKINFFIYISIPFILFIILYIFFWINLDKEKISI